MRSSLTIRAGLKYGYERSIPISVRERIRLWRGGRPVFVEDFERHRCVFIHVPKTGGLSVASALFGHEATSHRPVSAFIAADEARFEQYFSFAFVRNPFDRLYSAYRFLKGGGRTIEDARFAEQIGLARMPFPEFVVRLLPRLEVRTWVHFLPQTAFLVHRGRVRVDHVGRFETIERDFETIRLRLRIETASLPHVNPSAESRRPFEANFTPEAVRVVEKIYRKDLETFGYCPPRI